MRGAVFNIYLVKMIAPNKYNYQSKKSIMLREWSVKAV
jgi:hypothetical protein